MSLPVGLGLDGEAALHRNRSQLQEANDLPEKDIGLVWVAGRRPEADARQSRSEQRSLPPNDLVLVLNQQLGNRWKAGPIELVNPQDRPVPNHPLLQQYLPEATPSDSWRRLL